MINPRFCVLVNPQAGQGITRQRLGSLLKSLDDAGIKFELFPGEAPGQCRELARNARSAGHERFIIVGGDGTVHDVVNGILSTPSTDKPATLAVLPWGTGNDWAAYYNLPATVDGFIDLLRSGSTVLQDVGKASFQGAGSEEVRYFINCIGTGFDSYLLGHMGSGRGKRLRYLGHVLKCLRGYHAARLYLDLGNETINCSTLMLEVCLGKYIGAGMRIAPEADAGDGLFEVVLINELGRWQLLASLPYLYNGRINQHRAVRHIRCNRLSIESDVAQSFHCDGELVGRLPVQVDMLRGALCVVA